MHYLEVPFNDPKRYFLQQDELVGQFREFLSEGHYLGGIETTSFESELAEYLGTDSCIGVSSGTAALQLALKSLQLESGAEVLTTANAGGYASIAIRDSDLKVRYCEIGHFGEMDLDCARTLIEENKISTVIITHLFGYVQDIREFVSYCRLKNIWVIEDCAQSTGAKIGNSFAGSLGDLSTFSFYPTKNLGGIGDAGAICTSNAVLDTRIRMLREYGWKTRYFSESKGGGNYRIDSLHSMILRSGLRNLEWRNERRRWICQEYRQSLQGKEIELIFANSPAFVAHLAVLRLDNPKRLEDHLNAKGIRTAVHYPYPDYRQPGIYFGKEEMRLPKTDIFCKSILSIPCFPELTKEEVEHVVNSLKEYDGER